MFIYIYAYIVYMYIYIYIYVYIYMYMYIYIYVFFAWRTPKRLPYHTFLFLLVVDHVTALDRNH